MSLEQQQYQKLCRVLPTIREQWGWDVDERGWELPWVGNYLGFTIPLGQKEVTAEKVAWLWERECVAQVDKDQIILAPKVKVSPPPFCFHTTLFNNVPGILEKDLATGTEADRSTSKRKDCQGYIYVSFDLGSAKSWAGGNRLGKENPGQEWGIIIIDSRGLTKEVFRDPCSVDGYILEDKRVERTFLQLAERFPRDPVLTGEGAGKSTSMCGRGKGA